jgi:hypothetical protein
MRGAPHNGLAWLMRRIKSRISAVVCSLPDGRRDFQVQYEAKALRCQAMTVAGWTSCRHRRQPDQDRDNRTHNTRSERLRRKRRGAFRLENSQLVTKDENFGLQGGTGSKTRGITDDGKLCVFRSDGVFGTHTHIWASSLKDAKFIEFSRSVNHANPVT